MAGSCVLDKLALPILLDNEPGEERVRSPLGTAVMSAETCSEVVANIVERGGTLEMVSAMLDPLHIDIVSFDRSKRWLRACPSATAPA